MDQERSEIHGKERLYRLLKTTNAAEELARRYPSESVRLYEEVLANLSTYGDTTRPTVQAFIAKRKSDPPPPDGPDRLGRLRADIALGLRAHFGDLAEAGDRVASSLRRGAVAIALVAFAVVALSVVLSFTRRDLSVGAKWEASSAVNGTKKSGVLPKTRLFDDVPSYFFHTEEEKDPHVDIDLGSTRTIASVDVTNRIDCCTDRARKLDLWLGDEHKKFRRVARRSGPVDARRFTFDAKNRPARYVRLSIPGKGILHLACVRVFGR